MRDAGSTILVNLSIPRAPRFQRGSMLVQSGSGFAPIVGVEPEPSPIVGVEPSSWDEWLGGRDSNPDTQIQSLQSYH